MNQSFSPKSVKAASMTSTTAGVRDAHRAQQGIMSLSIQKNVTVNVDFSGFCCFFLLFSPPYYLDYQSKLGLKVWLKWACLCSRMPARMNEIGKSNLSWCPWMPDVPPSFQIIPDIIEQGNTFIFHFYPFLWWVSARSWFEGVKVRRNTKVTQGHGGSWLHS